MVDNKKPSPFNDNNGVEYEIKIKSHLEEHWADWLGGLSISHEAHGNSLLTGVVPDQAAWDFGTDTRSRVNINFSKPSTDCW